MNFETAQVIKIEKEEIKCFVCEHCQRELSKLVTLQDDQGETMGVGTGCAKSLRADLGRSVTHWSRFLRNGKWQRFGVAR